MISINPLIGLILGGLDFSGLSFSVGDATFTYGNLIMAIINFLVVAIVLFFVIQAMNTLTRKEAAKPSAPVPPTKDQELLAEIRDLLSRRTQEPQLAASVVAAEANTPAAPKSGV